MSAERRAPRSSIYNFARRLLVAKCILHFASFGGRRRRIKDGIFVMRADARTMSLSRGEPLLFSVK